MVVPWICVSISKSQVIWGKPKKRPFFSIFRKNALIAISRKRHFWSPNRKISENRPPQSTPQNLGKLTSETTFGHSKVVFSHCCVQNGHFFTRPSVKYFKNAMKLSIYIWKMIIWKKTVSSSTFGLNMVSEQCARCCYFHLHEPLIPN